MRGKIPRKLLAFFLFSSILLSGYLYRDSFGAYFFQDDWFSFRISQASSFSDFFAFFLPRSDVIYYRPLGMQLPFFILRSIFGFSPLPFHILAFATHTINVILVFVLVRLLTKREIVALLSAFFYATSAVHYIPFFWSATYAFALGPTAFFLSFILFLVFLDRKKTASLLSSLVVFILGLLTSEMVVVLPVIIFVYILLFKKSKLSSYLLSYIFVSLLIFLPRFIFFPPPSEGIYQLGLGRHILTNIKTYFFWSFNWSEILTEQMIKPFHFNTEFTREYGVYITVSLITFFISLVLFYILPLFLTKLKLDKKFLRLFALGIAWFIIGLSPVFLFPYHKYPYYLPISLVGFLIISAVFICKMFAVFYKLNRGIVLFFLFILVSNWVLSTKTTIDLNLKIHWAPRRAKIARRLIEKAKRYYKYPLEKPYVYVSETSENKWALNDQDAFRLIYEDGRIKTIYTDKAGENIL